MNPMSREELLESVRQLLTQYMNLSDRPWAICDEALVDLIEREKAQAAVEGAEALAQKLTGGRCADHDDDCVACITWSNYDHLITHYQDGEKE